MGKKKEIVHVKCTDCKFATLILYREDSVVISKCSATGEREVANASRVCDLYEKDIRKKEIQKLYEMF